MEPMTLREIVEASQGAVISGEELLPREIGSVETDSRTIHPGALFVPLSGERFDGHAYIASALEGGALACFTARERESYLPGKCYIKVKDPLRAMRALAVHYRKKFSVPIVAVTGSVGKTTTKDMVAAVLGERYRVLKTEGNLNTDVGTCATLFRLDRETQAAVLEMGMNHPGEIEVMSALAEPDICLITNIGDSHIEYLGSRENILKAKCEIFSHAKEPVTAVLNGDDELLRQLTPGVDTVRCGRGEGLEYRALAVRSDGGSGSVCEVKTPYKSFTVEIPAPGEHMIYPVLMAAAVGEKFGLSAEEIRQGVLHFEPTKMRMNVLSRKNGITILNDAYNANPQSMRAAVEVLAKSHGCRIAVLGDMFELGALAQPLHEGVGAYLGKAGIDCLVAVGTLAKHIYDAAKDAMVPQVYWSPTKEEAKPILKELLRPNATILVKASRGMAFEELVEYLKELTEQP